MGISMPTKDSEESEGDASNINILIPKSEKNAIPENEAEDTSNVTSDTKAEIDDDFVFETNYNKRSDSASMKDSYYLNPLIPFLMTKKESSEESVGPSAQQIIIPFPIPKSETMDKANDIDAASGQNIETASVLPKIDMADDDVDVDTTGQKRLEKMLSDMMGKKHKAADKILKENHYATQTNTQSDTSTLAKVDINESQTITEIEDNDIKDPATISNDTTDDIVTNLVNGKYGCSKCNYQTKVKDEPLARQNIKLHIKAVHDKFKDMIGCTLCDYKTSTESNLKIHERSHKQEYILNNSNQEFKATNEIDTHLIKSENGCNTNSSFANIVSSESHEPKSEPNLIEISRVKSYTVQMKNEQNVAKGYGSYQSGGLKDFDKIKVEITNNATDIEDDNDTNNPEHDDDLEREYTVMVGNEMVKIQEYKQSVKIKTENKALRKQLEKELAKMKSKVQDVPLDSIEIQSSHCI